MIGSNKILTVSYGTFSCTLEGFDDSFGTMKAIAEYFRDLAADDRYFGAEPPTPDAEMLARIAEREISRRVEARLENGGFVLRAALDTPTADDTSADTSHLADPQAAAPVDDPVEDTETGVDGTHDKIPTDAVPAPGPPPETAVERDTGTPVAENAEAQSADAGNTELEITGETPAAPEVAPETESDASDTPDTEPAADMSEAPALDVSELRESFADAEDARESVDMPAGELPAETVQTTQGAPDAAALIRDFMSRPDTTGVTVPTDDATSLLEDEEETAAASAPAAAVSPTPSLPETDTEEDDSVAAKLRRIRAVVSRAEARPESAYSEDEHAEDFLTDPARDIDDILRTDVESDDAPARDTRGLAEAAQAPEDPQEPETVVETDAADADTQPEDARHEDAAPAHAPRVVRVKRAQFEQAVASGMLEQEPETDAESAGADDSASDGPGSLSAEDEADLLRELAEVEAELKAADAASQAESAGRMAEAVVVQEEATEERPRAGTGDDWASYEAFWEADADAEDRPDTRAATADFAGEGVDDDDFEAEYEYGYEDESHSTVDDDSHDTREADVAEADEDGAETRPLAAEIEGKPVLDDDGWEDDDRAEDQDAAPEMAADDDDATFAEQDVETDRFQDMSHGEDQDEDDTDDDAGGRAKQSVIEGSIIAASIRAVARKTVKLSGEGRAMLTSRPVEDESSVNRLMDETTVQMDEPDGKGRRSAIQHLRAAVAATRAEKTLDPGHDTTDAAEAYRDDLANVVRPRRPVRGTAQTARPSADARPAPLKLVAEQRVDVDTAPKQVLPRRVASIASAADAGDTGGFAEFAEKQGATSLPDLLEAAAAYMSFVEGREQFSRPQLMTRVRAVNEKGFNREDGLRSFGQLLRQGKIEKLSGGRFTVSDQIGFKPDARAVG